MNQEFTRVNRLFHLDNLQTGYSGWYFEVRDGQSHGPYASLRLAEMALRIYLGGLEKTQRSGRSLVGKARRVDQETRTI